MTTETTPELELRERAPLWRRLVRRPTVWGTLLLVLAVVLTSVGDGPDFLLFLLMIVGGWCFGFSFTNAVFRMPSSRDGFILHFFGAVVAAAVVVVLTESGGALLAPLPLPARAIVFVVQMAMLPAATWILLALIGRVIEFFGRKGAARAPVRTAPTWEQAESGGGATVRFGAIEARMRVITLGIVGIVVVVGALGIAMLIVLNDLVLRVGARLSIIALGLLIGFPAYLLFAAFLQRRTVASEVTFGSDELRIVRGERVVIVPYSQLEFLRWQPRSDYARVEARGAGADLSLLVGLAKALPGRTAELPPLSRRVYRLLEAAGMKAESSRRGELVTFLRE